MKKNKKIRPFYNTNKNRMEIVFERCRPKMKEYLEEKYHLKYNSYVNRKYDPKYFQEGDIKNYKAWDHQKSSALKFTTELNGLADHKTGSGKTLTMIMTAYKAKSLNLIKKPMIIGLIPNIKEIAETFKKAYPNSKILCPDENEFTKSKRKEMLAKIQLNDWDCIIITHQQFMKIPQSIKIEENLLEETKEAITSDLNSSETQTGGQNELKGLQIRLNNIEVRLKTLQEKRKELADENLPTFKEMGIDLLQVDEWQYFKNLMYTTRHHNISGLGNPEGSQMASNLLVAVRTLQDHHKADKGAIFYTATPLSNSIVETYTLFNYLTPNQNKKQDIFSFDAWLSLYVKIKPTFKFDVSNQIKIVNSCTEYNKLPELSNNYRKLAHIINENDIKEYIKEPEINHILVNIEPSEAQKEYYVKLVEYIKSKGRGRRISGEYPNPESLYPPYMLLAINDARKLSLDHRMINSEIPYVENSKIGNCSLNVAKQYKLTNNDKGAQVIFCDLGTPNSTSNQINIYEKIKSELTQKYQIPSKEIQFIHHYEKREKRKALFEAVNNGDVRVIIGSTEKLGTGVNMQKKLISVHHMDIKWRPIDMIQRNGRAKRTGNEIAEKYGNQINSYYYMINRSLDSYILQVNNTKQMMITQFKAETANRRITDIRNENNIPIEEFQAIVSDNQDLLEKIKIEREIEDLKQDKDVFFSVLSNNRTKVKNIKENTENLKNQNKELKQQSIHYQEFYPPNVKTLDKQKRIFPIPVIIDNKEYHNYTQIEKKIKEKYDKSVTGDTIATFNKFTAKITIQEDLSITHQNNEKDPEDKVHYYIDVKEIEKKEQIVREERQLGIFEEKTTTKKGIFNEMILKLNKIKNIIENNEKKIIGNKEEVKSIEKNNLNLKFPKEKELDILDKKLITITKKIHNPEPTQDNDQNKGRSHSR